MWACNLCRKKQELALKTGQWYHGSKGSALQRTGSLVRQSSLSSDTETSGRRMSRDLTIAGSARRSNSAHALMETDKMDENGNHRRLKMRKSDESERRSNGDISRPIRLRGEMETTPFIIPKSKPTLSLSRQSSVEPRSPTTQRKLASSMPSAMHQSAVDSGASQQQMSPSQSVPSKSYPSPAAAKLPTDTAYGSRGLQPSISLTPTSVSTAHTFITVVRAVYKYDFTLLCSSYVNSNYYIAKQIVDKRIKLHSDFN